MSIRRVTQFPFKRYAGFAVLAAALATAAVTAVAAQPPSFFAGLFRFAFDQSSEGDNSIDVWLRNPVVLDDALMIRRKEGNDSSVSVYPLAGLAEHVSDWRLEPLAVGRLPDRREQSNESSLQHDSAPVITALFAGPAFGGLVEGDSAARLWGLRGKGFEEVSGGPYLDFIRKDGARIEATVRLVRVDDRVWFECGGPAASDCAALVTHGLDWAAEAAGSGGRLALGFADTGERRWVCVIGHPGGACRSAGANRVAGRQPLLSGDGNLLAAAVERRADQGRGEHEGWDIQVLRISGAGDLTPVATIPRIALYGAKGQGGDYVAYKGSYAWLGSDLYFQEAESQPRQFARWSEARGVERLQLPGMFLVFNPRTIGSMALKERLKMSARQCRDALGSELIWLPASHDTGISAAAAPSPSGVERAGSGDLTRLAYQLIDLYAVQPFQVPGDPRTFLLVQALVKEETQPPLPLERILIYTLE